mgnify:CR=1 FL=1
MDRKVMERRINDKESTELNPMESNTTKLTDINERCNDFFVQYATAIKNFDLNELKSSYALPFIVVSDEPKSVISFDQELENKIKQFLIEVKNSAVVDIQPKIQKTLVLAEQMIFVSINWSYRDENSQILHEYINSYMLSDTDSELKIVTLIVDDQNDLFLSFLD